MLDLRIMSSGRAVPLGDLPAALGRAGAAQELGDTIEALIAFMDDLGGDPDLEDDDPDTSVEDDERGFDPETDYGADDVGEDEELVFPPDCDPALVRAHRDRIRRTRCEKVVHYNKFTGSRFAEYRLPDNQVRTPYGVFRRL